MTLQCQQEAVSCSLRHFFMCESHLVKNLTKNVIPRCEITRGREIRCFLYREERPEWVYGLRILSLPCINTDPDVTTQPARDSMPLPWVPIIIGKGASAPGNLRGSGLRPLQPAWTCRVTSQHAGDQGNMPK